MPTELRLEIKLSARYKEGTYYWIAILQITNIDMIVNLQYLLIISEF